MTINLKISKDSFNEAFLPLLYDYSHRWEVYMGSSGSGKSYFIAEKLIIRCCTETVRVLICRQTGRTLRQSTWNLIQEILTKWQLLPYVNINKSDYTIKFPSGSEMIFTGLDEETKLLSINNISVIWVEEAFEVLQTIVEQLNLRMRGQAEQQQIIMSFNPISAQSWLHEFVNQPPESFIFHHSTYKDNKFLSPEYIKALEELRIRNPQKARIFCDGEWGIDSDGLVLKNWRVEEFDKDFAAKNYKHFVGADLGYIDPTAIVSSFYDEATNTIYVADEFYKSGQQLDDVFDAIRRMGLSHSTIYFDSAEPRTIDYFRRKGLAAYPCIKGAGSVKARLMFLQNATIVIHPDCQSFITNISNFSYEKNKVTGQFDEDKTTHEFSHAIDALSYAYSPYYTKGGRIKPISKDLLGL